MHFQPFLTRAMHLESFYVADIDQFVVKRSQYIVFW